MPFSADEDSAISLCRMAYEGDCRCEKNGRVVCAPVLRQVEEMRSHLDNMRAAFAGQNPEGKGPNGSC